MYTLNKILVIIWLFFMGSIEVNGQATGFEKRITLITLSVEDLQISAKFYEQVLGWERAAISSEGIYFYRLNGITVALLPDNQLSADAQIEPAENSASQFSIAYYTQSKEEVDQLMTKLKREGAEIVLEAGPTYWGGYRGYFKDPDGFLWEVMYNPLDEGWDVNCGYKN